MDRWMDRFMTGWQAAWLEKWGEWITLDSLQDCAGYVMPNNENYVH